MSIDIHNGAAVSRFYSDGSGELLAVFRYVGDADRWAEGCLSEPVYKGLSLVRTNLYDGTSRMFKGSEKENG